MQLSLSILQARYSQLEYRKLTFSIAISLHLNPFSRWLMALYPVLVRAYHTASMSDA